MNIRIRPYRPEDECLSNNQLFSFKSMNADLVLACCRARQWNWQYSSEYSKTGIQPDARQFSSRWNRTVLLAARNRRSYDFLYLVAAKPDRFLHPRSLYCHKVKTKRFLMINRWYHVNRTDGSLQPPERSVVGDLDQAAWRQDLHPIAAFLLS
jgi:hypothetical protein